IMEAQIKLGRIFGIQIGRHYSWLIIAVLISLSLSSYFAGAHPDWSRGVIWAMAVATAILFFVAIVLHELSHATVAKMRGLPVSSITLFALGGVAQLDKEPEDAKTEFWMAIAGPIASSVIGLVCLGLAWTLGWSPSSEPVTPLMAMLVWLGYINIVLAIFNTMPGYPMDGGRVLRAVIWWITGNANRATRIASVTGQFIAFGFIFLGLWQFFWWSGFRRTVDGVYRLVSSIRRQSKLLPGRIKGKTTRRHCRRSDVSELSRCGHERKFAVIC
ncbi:MAG: site-2 protease family protein, partial [Pyrinomonadaceae bacterium]